MKLKATCMHEASNVWSSCLAKCYFCSFQDGCCESSLRGAAGRSPETRLPYCRRLRICKAHECVSILPSMSNQSLVLLFAKTAFFFFSWKWQWTYLLWSQRSRQCGAVCSGYGRGGRGRHRSSDSFHSSASFLLRERHQYPACVRVEAPGAGHRRAKLWWQQQ